MSSDDQHFSTSQQGSNDIEQIWAEEAVRRLMAYREGRLKGIPMSEVFAEYEKGSHPHPTGEELADNGA